MQNLPFHLLLPSLYPDNRPYPKGGRKSFRSVPQADMGAKQNVSIFSAHTSSRLLLPSKVSFLLWFGHFNQCLTVPGVCRSMPLNTFCQSRKYILWRFISFSSLCSKQLRGFHLTDTGEAARIHCSSPTHSGFMEMQWILITNCMYGFKKVET